jgi:tRNA-2-methylthio-N6-dimethylallyladenosine synthase
METIQLTPLVLSDSDTVASTGWHSPPRYYTWTIGCQMNKADTERLESALAQLGFVAARGPADADVIVLNSCVVRQSAEDKVVGALTSFKPLKSRQPGRIIALMGCMVGPRTEQLQQRFSFVDAFMRPQQYGPLLDLVGKRLGVDWEGCLGPLAPLHPQVTAYVPIIHGCDEMCSFCIIPYRRGREVSRPIHEVVREVELLAQRGAQEVTLLGQTVDAYGNDLADRPDLADLLYAIHDIEGLRRIRFLTSHPRYMSERIVRAVADLPKVCEHINLPFQAGDDQVLQRMRRTYTRDDYRRLIAMVRSTIPGVSLSTDVIVGFCGETEEQFQRSVDLLEEVRFDKVHIAAYSPRPGTIAFRGMPDDVPPEEKERRKRRLEEVQERIATEINAGYVGGQVEVLVDGKEKGRWKGRTRTDKLVFFDSKEDLLGRLVSVNVDKGSPWALQGSIIELHSMGLSTPA